MADPQVTTTSTQSRAKGDANAGAATEPRSFDQERTGGRPSAMGEGQAGTLARAAEPMIDGGRQLAEQGRRASRQMADAWRQAADPLLAMQFEATQWFDDLFRQTFGFRAAPMAFRPMGHLSPALFGLPPAELRETKGAHVLAIELPGMTREDVDLSIQGDTLVVSGHKAEENEDASASYRVNERRYGRFERAFPLPADVERGRIEAQFRDGVLKVRLPKAADAAPQRARIEIKG